MLYKEKSARLPPRFYEVTDNIIRNDMSSINWVYLSKNDIIMFVGKLDYTENTAAVGNNWATPSLNWILYNQSDWAKVNMLWQKKKKISGGIFLTPRGENIWVSNFDLKLFENITK